VRISKTQIKAAIQLVHEIEVQFKLYALSPTHSERSVDDLLRICRQYRNNVIAVNEHSLRYEGQPILGFYLLKDDGSCDICLLSGLNFCWKRFVLCKELFHVILNDPEYQTKDLKSHIEATIAHFPDVENTTPVAVASEMLAEMAAMEFLFPYRLRKLHQAGVQEISVVEALAMKHRIPTLMVNKYLTSNYMKFLSYDFLGLTDPDQSA
jgi:hypothetical protein